MRTAPILGAGGPRRRRPPSLVPLLVCTLVLAAMLAYEARAAVLSQRETAERELHDDASLAATEFASGLVEELKAGVGDALSPVTGSRATSPYENLPGPAIVAVNGAHALRCPDPRADSLRYYFRLDFRDSALTITGARPSAAEERWLRDQIAGRGRNVYQEHWGFAIASERTGDQPAAVVYAVKYAEHQAPIAAFGFRTCANVIDGSLFRRVIDRSALLPRSWTGGAPIDSVLVLTVTDPSGDTVFASRRAPGSPYSASAHLDEIGLGSAVASIRPPAIETLMMDATPQSRVPVLVGLLILTGGMVAVALTQLRREAELARLRADFISSVSHELRTPLSQMLLFAETLELGRVRSDEERRAAASVIVEEGRRLMHLVENVLLFTRTDRRMTRLAPEPVALEPCVRRIVTEWLPLARGTRVELVDVPGATTVVTADPSALRQMVLNLLDNAVKYGPPGQTIRVRLSTGPQHARITVEDEGPGIAERDRERVWHAFYRLERHASSSIAGSGIGLYVVRELARLQGGDAWVERGDTGGARFLVQLARHDGRV